MRSSVQVSRFQRPIRVKRTDHALIRPDRSYVNDTGSNGVFHAVLWKDRIPHNLGVFGEDVNSAALGLNNLGAVVGSSVGGDGNPLNSPARAFLWDNGVMY